MIYTLGGIKGGSGKTTIATNLVIFLAKQERDVLLVDADNQESATDFTAFRNQTLGGLDYTSVKITGGDLNSQVKRLSTKYDDIVIDVGGRDTVSQRSALTISDVALFPFGARSFDIWTLNKVDELVGEVLIFNPDLVTFCFINKADSRGSYTDAAADILGKSRYLHYLDTSIGNRISFANASSEGLGVMELQPIDNKAFIEISELFNRIKNSLIDS